jgi:hypothetical protein
MLTLSVAVMAVVAACSNGPTAPPVGESALVCTDAFCLSYPQAWAVVDQGAEHVALAHPQAPDSLLASVAMVNLEALVVAAGELWPQQPDAVVRIFWSQIDGGDADVGEVRPQLDGSVRSVGVFRGGRLWFALYPIDASHGVGVEVRAPNRTWETHAAVFMDGLRLLAPS